MRSRLLPLAALATLSVYLAVAMFLGLGNAGLRWRAAARTFGLPPTAVRSRVFGPRYVAGIDRIRRTIAVDEPYLLAEQETPGAMLWVRFDLLPRRAVVIGPPQERAGDCWLPQIRWVVVGVATGRPPVLLEQRPSVPAGCPPAPWTAAAGGRRDDPRPPQGSPR
jgi:hypothetical protein